MSFWEISHFANIFVFYLPKRIEVSNKKKVYFFVEFRWYNMNTTTKLIIIYRLNSVNKIQLK